MFGVAKTSDQRTFSENTGSLSEAGERRKGEALRDIAKAPVKTKWGQMDSHDSIQTAEPSALNLRINSFREGVDTIVCGK